MISMISVILNQIFRIFFDGVVRLKKAWIPSFTPQLLGHQLKYILAAAQVFTTAALIFSTDTVFQTNIPLLQLLGKTTFLILSCLIAYLIINKSKIKEKFRLSFLLLIAIINYHSLHFLTVITKTTDIINEFSFQIQTYTMQEPTLYYYQFIKPFNESELKQAMIVHFNSLGINLTEIQSQQILAQIPYTPGQFNNFKNQAENLFTQLYQNQNYSQSEINWGKYVAFAIITVLALAAGIWLLKYLTHTGSSEKVISQTKSDLVEHLVEKRAEIAKDIAVAQTQVKHAQNDIQQIDADMAQIEANFARLGPTREQTHTFLQNDILEALNQAAPRAQSAREFIAAYWAGQGNPTDKTLTTDLTRNLASQMLAEESVAFLNLSPNAQLSFYETANQSSSPIFILIGSWLDRQSDQLLNITSSIS